MIDIQAIELAKRLKAFSVGSDIEPVSGIIGVAMSAAMASKDRDSAMHILSAYDAEAWAEEERHAADAVTEAKERHKALTVGSDKEREAYQKAMDKAEDANTAFRRSGGMDTAAAWRQLSALMEASRANVAMTAKCIGGGMAAVMDAREAEAMAEAAREHLKQVQHIMSAVASLSEWVEVNKPKRKTSGDVMTDRAREYFARALERGYMKRDGRGGYVWELDGGNKTALAAFIVKAFDGEYNHISWKDVGAMFGVDGKGLSGKLWQRKGNKNRQRWEDAIDNL